MVNHLYFPPTHATHYTQIEYLKAKYSKVLHILKSKLLEMLQEKVNQMKTATTSTASSQKLHDEYNNYQIVLQRIHTYIVLLSYTPQTHTFRQNEDPRSIAGCEQQLELWIQQLKLSSPSSIDDKGATPAKKFTAPQVAQPYANIQPPQQSQTLTQHPSAPSLQCVPKAQHIDTTQEIKRLKNELSEVKQREASHIKRIEELITENKELKSKNLALAAVKDGGPSVLFFPACFSLPRVPK